MDTKTNRALCLFHHGFLSARFQRALLTHAPQALERSLKKHGLCASSTVYTTPHHLVMIVDNVPAHITLTSKVMKGPFVHEGPQALENFLSHIEASRENVHTKTLPQGECYFAHAPPQKTSTWPLVQEAVIDALHAPFHKRMYWWEQGSFLWARPIHGYTAFWNNHPQQLPLPERIPALHALPGHHVTHPAPFPCDPSQDPREIFRTQGIILCHKERVQCVKEHLESLGDLSPLSSQLIEDIALGVQYPTLITCPIDTKYADLDTTVVQHIIEQKLCAIALQNNGAITHFATIVDHSDSNVDKDAISQGFRNVCHAALEDALFFMNKDTLLPLESYAPSLDKRLIHEDIGTLGGHIQRLVGIVENGTHFGHDATAIIHAIKLMKCDIETLMVHEYPSLQGHIGTLYARKHRIQETVAQAIYEHYLPLGPASPIPSSDIGAICAFLDKTLSLVSFISVGRKPTSSKDPFGVRRLALGLIRIAQHYPWTGSLHTLIVHCINSLQHQKHQDDIIVFLHQFLQDRIVHYARTTYPLPLIKAACQKTFTETWDIHHTFSLMQALHTHPHTATTIQTYKRAFHLAPHAPLAPTVEPTESLDTKLTTALKAYTHSSDLAACMDHLHTLALTVEEFCDKTFIATEDTGLRHLRQSMLRQFCGFCDKIADFSALIDTP